MQLFVRHFLDDRQSQNASMKTLEWHKYSLQRFERFLEKEDLDKNPMTWTRFTLRSFLVHLQEEDLSDYSIRTYANSVWAFCRWLYREDVIEEDIAERAKKPKIPNRQKTPFSEKEVLSLIEAAKNTHNGLRDAAIILVLLDTGIRNSELCNLKETDLLVDDGLVVIREGKGDKLRSAPVSMRTLVAISKYRNKINKGTPSRKKNDYLFLNKRGTKLTASGLFQLVRRIATAAGVDDAHPHRFRHTSALMFLRNGGDSLALQKILGHETLDMTRKYVQYLSDDLISQHAFASPVLNLKIK